MFRSATSLFSTLPISVAAPGLDGDHMLLDMVILIIAIIVVTMSIVIVAIVHIAIIYNASIKGDSSSRSWQNGACSNTWNWNSRRLGARQVGLLLSLLLLLLSSLFHDKAFFSVLYFWIKGKLKVYSCRDLSPHRPFQELTIKLIQLTIHSNHFHFLKFSSWQNFCGLSLFCTWPPTPPPDSRPQKPPCWC